LVVARDRPVAVARVRSVWLGLAGDLVVL